MKTVQLPIPLLSIVIPAWVLSVTESPGQWSTNPNVNTAICTAANNQEYLTIVSDGVGGAIITWEDYRNGLVRDIYVQKVNASGVVQWTTDGVLISTALGIQQSPAIVGDGAGGAIIAWADRRSGNFDIYAQRFNAFGVAQWTTDGVPISVAVGDQGVPAIVSDGSGGAMITWRDSRSNPGDIYAQRVNASGVAQWTADGIPISTAAGNKYSPTIVSDGAGGAIITWYDLNPFRSVYYDIYAQKVNASGVVQWTVNGVPISTAFLDQNYPTIVSDDAGGAIITWEDYRNGTNYDIYAQRVNAAGLVQWTANGVAICVTAEHQYRPTIVSDGAGGAIITWDDYRGGTYVQRVNASGVMQWTLNGALIFFTQNALSTRMVGDGAGGAIITWAFIRSDNADIYAQRVNAAGLTQWTTNGVPISSAAGHQNSPIIVSDGAGGGIITWRDYRNGGSSNLDLYAQQVSANGQLGVVTVVQDDVGALPESFRLEQNYPNPFNPTTTISFDLPSKSLVSLEVFDALGRQVSILVAEVLTAGTHSRQWNAAGSPSGVYFYRFRSRDFAETKKLILLR